MDVPSLEHSLAGNPPFTVSQPLVRPWGYDDELDGAMCYMGPVGVYRGETVSKQISGKLQLLLRVRAISGVALEARRAAVCRWAKWCADWGGR